ncbi:MAG: hypothetical protein ACOVQN_11590 [Exiguobacterium sp.]
MASVKTLQLPFITNPPGIGTQNSRMGAEAYYAYFGMPQTQQPIRAYEGIDQTMRTFPEALRGQSVFLSNTFTLLAFTQNSFLTTAILPLKYSNDTNYTWSETVFHPYLPEQVPHLGVVRFVKSQTQTKSKALMRFGIGLTLEHGFMETEMGRQHYVMEIRQIAQAINEGLQFEALYALMNAQTWELDRLRQMQGDHTSVQNAHVDAVIERELQTWAFIQQTRYAWFSLNDYVERAIETYSTGGFNTWIVDVRVESFRKRVAEDQTTFSIHGPGFMEAMQQGAQYYSVDSSGNVVYATRSFLVGENTPVNPLESTAQIGEMVRCVDVPDTDYSNYQSSSRDQRIYNEDADVFQTIPLASKLEHCARFKPDGSLLTFTDLRVNATALDDLADQQRDFLHYVTPGGELRPLSLFGQLRPAHFNTKDYQNLARTAFGELARNSYSTADYERAFSTIIECIDRASKVPYDGRYEAWVVALTAWNTTLSAGNAGPNAFPAASGVGDIQGNKYGSLDMFPTKTDEFALNAWTALPPTHITYGGFKTIQDMYEGSNKGYFDVFNEKVAKKIADAMPVFDDFAAKISSYFPNSLAASPMWVSPNIHTPSAHDAIFENLLARRFPSRALFVRPLNAVPAGLAGNITALVGTADDAALERARQAIRTTVAGNTDSLADVTIENNFPTIQPSQSTLFSSVTGPLELLRSGEGARGNIGLQMNANDVNIVAVPGAKLSAKATAIKDDLKGDYLTKIQLWMMSPVNSMTAAAAKAKILLWLAFVKVGDWTPSNTKTVANRFRRVIDALDAQVFDIMDATIASTADYTAQLEVANARLNRIILNELASAEGIYTATGADAVTTLLAEIDDIAKPRSGTLPTAGPRDYNDLQNFRAAPIRIGRTAFIGYVNTKAYKSSRFIPSSDKYVHAPMTQQELADSSDQAIWSPMYSQAGNESSDIINLPLVKNAKARLVNGSAPRTASTFRVPEFPATVRPTNGMPSLHGSSLSKRARQNSAIVGGTLSPSVGSVLMPTPELETDNIDEELPQYMKDMFRQLSVTFDGQIGTQLVSFIFMFTPVTKQALEATINYNLLHPFDYIIARPHATYRTVASIKMKPGAETGNTLIGNMQVTVGDDTTVQVIQAAVRFYQGAIIYHPENIFVVRNSMVVGYHGGLGCGFIDPDPSKYNPSIGMFGETREASIIAIAIPRHEVIDGRALSLNGKLISVDPSGRVDVLTSSPHKYTYNTAAFYIRRYRFFSVQWNEPGYTISSPGVGDIVPNLVVFSSTALYRDPKSAQWILGTSNLGHWKTHTVGAGMHNKRIGRESFLLSSHTTPYQVQIAV